jgi:hypothetical protein
MTRLVCLAATIVFGGLFATIAWKILTREISLDGILWVKRQSLSGSDTSFSPTRVQLMATTLITATYYLSQVVHDPTRFPSVPTSWLLGLGASHGIYLGGKAESAFSSIQNATRRRRKNEK